MLAVVYTIHVNSIHLLEILPFFPSPSQIKWFSVDKWGFSYMTELCSTSCKLILIDFCNGKIDNNASVRNKHEVRQKLHFGILLNFWCDENTCTQHRRHIHNHIQYWVNKFLFVSVNSFRNKIFTHSHPFSKKINFLNKCYVSSTICVCCYNWSEVMKQKTDFCEISFQ